MPSHGFHGLVASSESSLIMWSLPPPIVVYSSHVLYGWNQRMRSSPSTCCSVVAVLVQPGRLHVGADAERLAAFQVALRREVGVRDAEAQVLDRRHRG